MQRIRRNLKLFIQEETNFLQTTTIRSVHQLNEKFKLINDIYSFHNLIQQLNNNVSKLNFNRQKYQKFTRRLIQAICFAMQKYAYDFSRTSYLVQTLNSVRENWKKVLLRQFDEQTIKSNTLNSPFLYALHKNQFIYYLIKGSNALLEKQIFRLIKNNFINTKSLLYLKKGNIKNIWSRIHDQMIIIASQTQNQTYLKIQQLTQFLKLTLFQVNFCITQSDFQHVYQRLFQLALLSFRLIKKLYSIQIIPLIVELKKVILKGIQIYREISFQFPIKFNHLTNLIILFESKTTTSTKKVDFLTVQNRVIEVNNVKLSSITSNSKSYAVKLAFRLLDSWKKIKSKKNRQKSLKQKQVQQQNKTMFQFRTKNQDQNTNQNIIFQLQKQQFFLKSRTKKSSSLQNSKKNQFPALHKIYVRKQIQQQLEKQFGKLKYLKNYQNQSIKGSDKLLGDNSKQQSLNNRKSSFSKSSPNKKMIRSVSWKQMFKTFKANEKQKLDEREVNIEEYRERLNLCRKKINNQNRIKLYNPQKHHQVLHGGSIQKSNSGVKYGVKNMFVGSDKIKGRLRL